MSAVDEVMEKCALLGFGSVGQFGSAVGDTAGRAFGYGAGTAIAGTALYGIQAAAGKVYDAATKARDFKSMMEAHPDLQERDPRAVQQAFTTLRTFNSDFSRDPMVAGAAVKQLVANPESAAGFAGQLLESRGKMQGGMQDMFSASAQHGLRGGVDSMGREQEHGLAGSRMKDQDSRRHQNAMTQQGNQQEFTATENKTKNDQLDRHRQEDHQRAPADAAMRARMQAALGAMSRTPEGQGRSHLDQEHLNAIESILAAGKKNDPLGLDFKRK